MDKSTQPGMWACMLGRRHLREEYLNVPCNYVSLRLFMICLSNIITYMVSK
jgi:hypothetical protein